MHEQIILVFVRFCFLLGLSCFVYVNISLSSKTQTLFKPKKQCRYLWIHTLGCNHLVNWTVHTSVVATMIAPQATFFIISPYPSCLTSRTALSDYILQEIRQTLLNNPLVNTSSVGTVMKMFIPYLTLSLLLAIICKRFYDLLVKWVCE